MKYQLSLLASVLVVWLSLSGHFTPLLLGLGLVSCLGVVFLAIRMKIADDEGVPVGSLTALALYLPWLMWEIVKANLQVARCILDPRMPIRPRVFRTRASQKTEFGLALFANSITLTPGTVSMGIENGNRIVVHALTDQAAEGVETGEMDRRVTRVEGAS